MDLGRHRERGGHVHWQVDGRHHRERDQLVGVDGRHQHDQGTNSTTSHGGVEWTTTPTAGGYGYGGTTSESSGSNHAAGISKGTFTDTLTSASSSTGSTSTGGNPSGYGGYGGYGYGGYGYGGSAYGGSTGASAISDQTETYGESGSYTTSGDSKSSASAQGQGVRRGDHHLDHRPDRQLLRGGTYTFAAGTHEAQAADGTALATASTHTTNADSGTNVSSVETGGSAGGTVQVKPGVSRTFTSLNHSLVNDKGTYTSKGDSLTTTTGSGQTARTASKFTGELTETGAENWTRNAQGSSIITDTSGYGVISAETDGSKSGEIGTGSYTAGSTSQSTTTTTGTTTSSSTNAGTSKGTLDTTGQATTKIDYSDKSSAGTTRTGGTLSTTSTTGTGTYTGSGYGGSATDAAGVTTSYAGSELDQLTSGTSISAAETDTSFDTDTTGGGVHTVSGGLATSKTAANGKWDAEDKTHSTTTNSTTVASTRSTHDESGTSSEDDTSTGHSSVTDNSRANVTRTNGGHNQGESHALGQYTASSTDTTATGGTAPRATYTDTYADHGTTSSKSSSDGHSTLTDNSVPGVVVTSFGDSTSDPSTDGKYATTSHAESATAANGTATSSNGNTDDESGTQVSNDTSDTTTTQVDTSHAGETKFATTHTTASDKATGTYKWLSGSETVNGGTTSSDSIDRTLTGQANTHTQTDASDKGTAAVTYGGPVGVATVNNTSTTVDDSTDHYSATSGQSNLHASGGYGGSYGGYGGPVGDGWTATSYSTADDDRTNLTTTVAASIAHQSGPSGGDTTGSLTTDSTASSSSTDKGKSHAHVESYSTRNADGTASSHGTDTGTSDETYSAQQKNDGMATEDATYSSGIERTSTSNSHTTDQADYHFYGSHNWASTGTAFLGTGGTGSSYGGYGTTTGTSTKSVDGTGHSTWDESTDSEKDAANAGYGGYDSSSKVTDRTTDVGHGDTTVNGSATKTIGSNGQTTHSGGATQTSSRQGTSTDTEGELYTSKNNSSYNGVTSSGDSSHETAVGTTDDYASLDTLTTTVNADGSATPASTLTDNHHKLATLTTTDTSHNNSVDHSSPGTTVTSGSSSTSSRTVTSDELFALALGIQTTSGTYDEATKASSKSHIDTQGTNNSHSASDSTTTSASTDHHAHQDHAGANGTVVTQYDASIESSSTTDGSSSSGSPGHSASTTSHWHSHDLRHETNPGDGGPTTIHVGRDSDSKYHSTSSGDGTTTTSDSNSSNTLSEDGTYTPSSGYGYGGSYGGSYGGGGLTVTGYSSGGSSYSNTDTYRSGGYGGTTHESSGNKSHNSGSLSGSNITSTYGGSSWYNGQTSSYSSTNTYPISQSVFDDLSPRLNPGSADEAARLQLAAIQDLVVIGVTDVGLFFADGKLDDAANGFVDGFLAAVNPVEANFPLPKLGVTYGNDAAYADGEIAGVATGLVALFVVTPGLGLVESGTIAAKAVWIYNGVFAASSIYKGVSNSVTSGHVGVGDALQVAGGIAAGVGALHALGGPAAVAEGEGFGLFGKQAPAPSGKASQQMKDQYLKVAESKFFQGKINLLTKVSRGAPIDWDAFVIKLGKAQFNEYANLGEGMQSGAYSGAYRISDEETNWIFGAARSLRFNPLMGNAVLGHELFHAIQDVQYGLFGFIEAEIPGLRGAGIEAAAHLVGGPAVVVVYTGGLVGAVYGTATLVKWMIS